MNDALNFGRGIAFKRGDVSAEGTFSGYASTFTPTPDRHGDIVARGAFTKSLKQYDTDGAAPGMLWNHDFGEPIGKWLTLAEDSRGLKVTGKLSLALARAKDAYALLKDDALSLSIAYRVKSEGFEGRQKLLKELELFEISLVAVPANTHAQVTGVKGLRGAADLQRILQSAGFSQREAKRVVAGGWSALSRNDESTELNSAAALLRKHAAILTRKGS